jgi:hypothetical protein
MRWKEYPKSANVPDPGSSRGALVSNSSPKSAARGQCRVVSLPVQRTVVTILRVLDHFRQVQRADIFARMNCTLESRVQALLTELDSAPLDNGNESQTRRSEILEEMLQLVAISLAAQRKAEAGRWV